MALFQTNTRLLVSNNKSHLISKKIALKNLKTDRHYHINITIGGTLLHFKCWSSKIYKIMNNIQFPIYAVFEFRENLEQFIKKLISCHINKVYFNMLKYCQTGNCDMRISMSRVKLHRLI